MAAVLVESVEVPFTGGNKVRALRYADGSYRFRIQEGGPMMLSEAYMSGDGENVIVKLVPLTHSPKLIERVEEFMPFHDFNTFVEGMVDQLREHGQTGWALGTRPSEAEVSRLVPLLSEALVASTQQEVEYSLTNYGPTIVAVFHWANTEPDLDDEDVIWNEDA